MSIMRFCLIAAALVAWPAPLPAQDGERLPTADEVVNRLQKMADDSGIKQLGWRVFTKYGQRYLTQDMGLEVLGRFEAGKGIRTMATTLGCADAGKKRAVPGPNHYVIVHTDDQVSVAPIMLTLEAGTDPKAAFPFALFRARKGDPLLSEVEPLLLPMAVENLFFAVEPIVAFQLAPRTMFGHEAGLRVSGRTVLTAAGQERRCLVLESTRQAGEVRLRTMPYGWSRLVRQTRRYYVGESDGLIYGLEYDMERLNPAAPSGKMRDVWFTVVQKQQRPGGTSLALPWDAVMHPKVISDHAVVPTTRLPVTYRTVEVQSETFD